MRPGIALALAVLLVVATGCGSTTGTREPAPSGAAPPDATGSPGTGSSPSTSPGAEASVPAGSAPAPSTTSSSSPITEATPVPSTEPFQLFSPAFADQTAIPAEYTCRGRDGSPELDWSSVPAGARALVLFVDDPDGRDWVHWSVLDLAPTTTQLPAGLAPDAAGYQQGRNDFGKVGYGGPCPPSGTHHYRFRLDALAAPLGLSGHPDGAAVRAALARAHVLGRATLIGTFKA
jgi:Raf kinase inhibitor-like YbhB/YbcL family protein